MTEWIYKYNFPIRPVSDFKHYDDRLAQLKYGLIQVNIDGIVKNGVIVSPNGNDKFSEKFNNKLNNCSKKIELANLPLIINRLKIKELLSEYWILYGDVFAIEKLHEKKTASIFSNQGLKDLQSAVKTGFKVQF